MNFRNDKAQLIDLLNLMNEQSESPMIVTDDLAWVADAALTPAEVDFLLQMGGGNRIREAFEADCGMSTGEFEALLEGLLDKGHITMLAPQQEGGQPVLHLMSIFPGWFEFFLMRGAETPERQEFARRLSGYFNAARAFPPELLNAVMQDTAPHRSIVIAHPSDPRTVAINEPAPPPVSEIYPAHSVRHILEKLDANETITVGHCFCRQHRKMDGDPCRMDLPGEACLSLGPAAEHLLDRGIARRISKAEALALIDEAEQKGAVHQAGRLIPLKDFNPKYEVDIICNCCWDCCGAFGLYNRGVTPFVLKSYYIAEMADPDQCTGCSICTEFCPVRAVVVGTSGIAEIDPDLCVGCGLCALHCPDGVIQLKPFERDVFLPVLDESERRI